LTKFSTLLRYADKNRLHTTKSAKALQDALQNRFRAEEKLKQEKIYFEHIVPPYILDIFLPRFNIGIEIDGGIHNSRIEYDSRRDRYLERMGITMVRFDNETVDKHVKYIVRFIRSLMGDKQYRFKTKKQRNKEYSLKIKDTREQYIDSIHSELDSEFMSIVRRDA